MSVIDPQQAPLRPVARPQSDTVVFWCLGSMTAPHLNETARVLGPCSGRTGQGPHAQWLARAALPGPPLATRIYPALRGLA
ncbi:uncharacterized protein VTP21DRAFT_4936 [Calcarisporiella thermophila]|uniref:uncharacterized protein n=1 Tax=Calcarisporiella thermophila TaxID=911321 RepID=UPI003742EA8C